VNREIMSVTWLVLLELANSPTPVTRHALDKKIRKTTARALGELVKLGHVDQLQGWPAPLYAITEAGEVRADVIDTLARCAIIPDGTMEAKDIRFSLADVEIDTGRDPGEIVELLEREPRVFREGSFWKIRRPTGGRPKREA
jgi:hypothetical protein